MTLRIGDTAPDFRAETTRGRIDFHAWLGDSWGLLFSHPRDFTPVCTTELGRLALLEREFERRDVKLLGLSVDTVVSHEAWLLDIRETQGATVHFPIVGDLDRSVALRYEMLHPGHDSNHTVRTVFVIDPAKKVRLTIAYPQTCGRNFDEILRAIDSLQLTDSYDVATPVNWRAGDDVIILPSITDEEARGKFPRGWHALRPYLRVTPDPRA
jgi:alkyl hydroperoxide reductase subunit AhpC